MEEEKSFLDYIQSGVSLHFTVAVDFTASNGKCFLVIGASASKNYGIV